MFTYCFGLVSRSFCFYRFLNRDLNAWESVRKESIAKIEFSQRSFLMDFDSILSFVGGLGSRFTGFIGFENRLENRENFGDVADSKSVIWWGGSTPDFGPENSQQHSLLAESMTAHC